jgi:syntaxin 5
LGTIVRLHEVMIDRIDKNTEDSLINVEKGRKSLSEAYRSISSNRALIIKIFVIMIIFATIYIIFLV